MSKRYNTLHRTIKTCAIEEEHADFMERLTTYVNPIITMSPVNDELLAAVGAG